MFKHLIFVLCSCLRTSSKQSPVAMVAASVFAEVGQVLMRPFAVIALIYFPSSKPGSPRIDK